MNKRENIVLSFDLDNTLINNRKGIINSFNYALKSYNLPKLKRSKIENMIGIPLNDMFGRISNLNPNLLSTAFRKYYGNKGIYQSKLLAGVKRKLKELQNYSFKLGIITSKKQEMANKIVKILKIDKFFSYILGETEDRKELGKLDPSLKVILNELFPESKIIIIGDHPKDVLLSNNLNCPFIGVLTGHHSTEQLKRLKKGNFLSIKNIKALSLDIINSVLEWLRC